MFKHLTLSASLLVLGTSLALAQTASPGTPAPATSNATPNAPMPATGEPATKADSTMKEGQVAKLARISLSQALSTAEAQGGRAIDADFEKADGKDPAHYSVKVVYPSGKLVEYGINVDTGVLYKTENQPIERYFTFLKPANFNEAKTSLKDALAIAEQKAGGGKAYEAEVSKDGKAVQYQIKVAGVDKGQTVTVGSDGKVVD